MSEEKSFAAMAEQLERIANDQHKSDESFIESLRSKARTVRDHRSVEVASAVGVIVCADMRRMAEGHEATARRLRGWVDMIDATKALADEKSKS